MLTAKQARKLAVGFGIFAVSLFAIGAVLIFARTYSESSVFLSPCNMSGSDADLISKTRTQFRELRLSGGFVIAQHQSILARGFCGTENPASRISANENTQFNIGSLTKQFTGYLLL